MMTMMMMMISTVLSFHNKIISNNNIFNSNIQMNLELTSNSNNINVLQPIQVSLVIKNWIKYLNIIDYNMPEFIHKSTYDFNTFTAINKNENNIVFLSWQPSNKLPDQSLAYLIAGKRVENNIYIYRIAQNPFCYNIYEINSIDMYRDLKKFYYNNNISFSNLYDYDKRYLLSWKYI